ncbi:glycosyltransferase [Microbacterium sp. CGR1]|uniref:glycosyltransferase n=1 Tax=Microbacterium sp. CGR1 TaxID=1696072 RepID=UPI003DA28BAC
MVSVIIAAHNEEGVLGSCLDALIADADAGDIPIEIVVSANGCTDATVAVASSRGVVVIDRPDPGKADALNAAERVATRFPRIYLDADIVVPRGAVASLLDRFAHAPAPLAVVPRRRIDTTGRPWPVRSYFAINERLPVFRDGLFGRGMIAVSESGRRRFEAFPLMVADDLFLDAQFDASEKEQVDAVTITVDAPFTTRELVRRLVRVRRGNAQMRSAADDGAVDADVRASNRWSWLRDVVVPHPRLAFPAVPYVLITLIAGALARRPSDAPNSWRPAERNQDAGRGPR